MDISAIFVVRMSLRVQEAVAQMQETGLPLEVRLTLDTRESVRFVR